MNIIAEELPRPSNMYQTCKRLIDLCLVVPALVVLAPLMLVVSILIRRDSSGPALFTQQRVGRDGTPFTLYKFRTMRMDVDPLGFSPSTRDDPRLTNIGRFLREYSLDELPQLLNVLTGTMSLVGPRPLLMWQYEQWTPRQRQRLLVRPGITGWAQIHGRGEVPHDTKIELDLWYVAHAGIALDARILYTTLLQAIGRHKIYETDYFGAGQADRTAGKNERDRD